MSYRNPLHGLDAAGERETSVPGATIPGMSADSIETPTAPDPRGPTDADFNWTSEQEERAAGVASAFPMDHTGEPPEPLRCQDPTCPDFGDPDFGEGTCPAEHAAPRPIAVGEVITIDLAILNQLELERRVADGEPLPGRLTAADVARWRVEHPEAHLAAAVQRSGAQGGPTEAMIEAFEKASGRPVGRDSLAGITAVLAVERGQR